MVDKLRRKLVFGIPLGLGYLSMPFLGMPFLGCAGESEGVPRSPNTPPEEETIKSIVSDGFLDSLVQEYSSRPYHRTLVDSEGMSFGPVSLDVELQYQEGILRFITEGEVSNVCFRLWADQQHDAFTSTFDFDELPFIDSVLEMIAMGIVSTKEKIFGPVTSFDFVLKPLSNTTGQNIRGTNRIDLNTHRWLLVNSYESEHQKRLNFLTSVQHELFHVNNTSTALFHAGNVYEDAEPGWIKSRYFRELTAMVWEADGFGRSVPSYETTEFPERYIYLGLNWHAGFRKRAGDILQTEIPETDDQFQYLAPRLIAYYTGFRALQSLDTLRRFEVYCAALLHELVNSIEDVDHINEMFDIQDGNEGPLTYARALEQVQIFYESI